MKKILTFLLLIITFSLLFANCAAKESKENQVHPDPDTISQIDTAKNRCKMVDGGKAMILKKYELVNEVIKDEILSYVVDSLEMKEMHLNVLMMYIFKKYILKKEETYISFYPAEDNNVINVYDSSSKDFFGYFSIGKYDVVIKCSQSLSLVDINKFLKKAQGKKKFKIYEFLPYVGGREYVYVVGKDWNIYPLEFCGE